MKAKEFASLGKALASNLPKSIVRGPLISLVPVGQILRGFQFDGSNFDADSFYVWSFVLPLFVPTEFVHGGFGNRIRIRGGADRWDRTDPNFMSELNNAVQKDGLPLLLRTETVPGLIEALQEQLERSGGKATAPREALAYSLALTGQYNAAKEHLTKVIASLDRSIGWQKAGAERAELLMAKIAQGPEGVATQLQEWRSQTLRNLKLEDLASTPTLE